MIGLVHSQRWCRTALLLFLWVPFADAGWQEERFAAKKLQENTDWKDTARTSRLCVMAKVEALPEKIQAECVRALTVSAQQHMNEGKADLANRELDAAKRAGLPTQAKDWELVRTQGQENFVVIAKKRETEPVVYLEAIKELCPAGRLCSIHFWTSRKDVPKKWPMTDAQATAKAASYSRNPNTGLEEFLWNCRIKNNPNACFD